MTPVRAPSGEQVEIQAADSRATIVEVGGGLRSFEVADRHVIDGYGPEEMCTAGRGQVLAPWPNRLAGGKYSFGGRDLQLAVNDAPSGSAIHGLARWQRWGLERLSPDTCRATLPLPAQPGWPFVVDLAMTYTVAPGLLDVTLTATNAGDGPCPFGAGQHPYLAVAVDTATLHLPARTRLVLSGGLPTGETAAAQQLLAPVGDRLLDDCYTDLELTDGGWEVRVDPADGPSLRLWGSSAWRYLQVFSGDTVPEIARRRQGLAVEPMTCPPDAFASGEGLLVLQPGETFTGRWGICVGETARPGL